MNTIFHQPVYDTCMYSVYIILFVDTLVWTFGDCSLSMSNVSSSPTTVLHMNGEWKHITSLEHIRFLYSCAESRDSQCWYTLSGLVLLIRCFSNFWGQQIIYLDTLQITCILKPTEFDGGWFILRSGNIKKKMN